MTSPAGGECSNGWRKGITGNRESRSVAVRGTCAMWGVVEVFGRLAAVCWSGPFLQGSRDLPCQAPSFVKSPRPRSRFLDILQTARLPANMNSVRAIQQLNKRELEAGISPEGSWHTDYRDTAFIYIGGLAFELSEGDIITIFSQYGEPVWVKLARDKETGKSRGFAWIKYEDQRSCDLAVDNLGGATIMDRVVRVDHARYKPHDDEDMRDNTMGDVDVDAHGDSGKGRRKRRKSQEDSESEDDRPLLPEEIELGRLMEKLDMDDPMRDSMIKQQQEKVDEAVAKLKRKMQKEKERKRRHERRHRRDGSKDRSRDRDRKRIKDLEGDDRHDRRSRRKDDRSRSRDEESSSDRRHTKPRRRDESEDRDRRRRHDRSRDRRDRSNEGRDKNRDHHRRRHSSDSDGEKKSKSKRSVSPYRDRSPR